MIQAPTKETPRLHLHTNTHFQRSPASTDHCTVIPTVCAVKISQKAGKWSFFVHSMVRRSQSSPPVAPLTMPLSTAVRIASALRCTPREA